MSADTIYCPAQTYAQTFDSPAEWCENEVEDAGDLCADHEADERDDYDRERLEEDARDDARFDR